MAAAGGGEPWDPESGEVDVMCRVRKETESALRVATDPLRWAKSVQEEKRDDERMVVICTYVFMYVCAI